MPFTVFCIKGTTIYFADIESIAIDGKAFDVAKIEALLAICFG